MTLVRTCLASLAASMLSLPGVALAQDAPPTAPPATTPAPPSAWPTPPGAPLPDEAPPAAPGSPATLDPRTPSGFPEPPPPPAPTDARPRRVHADDGARFRGGASLLLGSYHFDGGGALGMAGVEGRLGAQVTRAFGIYATPAVIGAWEDGDRSFARVSVGAVFDATIDDLFFIGGGPEVFGLLRPGEGDTGGRAFALRMRSGFAFGSMRPSRRHAFVIGFDGRLDFYENGLGFAPLLALGYDGF